MKKIDLEVQYFEGCPNSREFINRIKKIIESTGSYNYKYKEILVGSNEIAKQIKFRGSPTLLINGVDLEEMNAPENPGLTCRYYPNGLPSKEEIKIKIEKAIKIV